MKTTHFISTLTLCLAILVAPAALATDIELQPLAAQAARIISALEFLGEPLDAKTKTAIEKAATPDEIQKLLDARVLFVVNINPEMRVKVAQGTAKPELVENGWRQFLVKVLNESGTTAALRASSPNAQRLFNSPQGDVGSRWLDLQTFDAQPLRPTLSGLQVEYRIIQLYSRDAAPATRAASTTCSSGRPPGFDSRSCRRRWADR